MRYLLLLLGFIFTITSCVKKDNDVNIVDHNIENISKFTDLRSHRAGENCMNCHISGGNGKGYFSVAGTVYDSTKIAVFPNRLIRLYSENNATGTLISELQVDGKGNFFTTDTISFKNGLYPIVLTSEGNFISMNEKVYTGQCSKCHGVTTGNIWTK